MIAELSLALALVAAPQPDAMKTTLRAEPFKAPPLPSWPHAYAEPTQTKLIKPRDTILFYSTANNLKLRAEDYWKITVPTYECTVHGKIGSGAVQLFFPGGHQTIICFRCLADAYTKSGGGAVIRLPDKP